MEDIFESPEANAAATVAAAMRAANLNESGSSRQEPYSRRDRQLLLSLMLEFDTEQILFSAKRDVDTCGVKKEMWKEIGARFNASSGRVVPSRTFQLKKLATKIRETEKRKSDPGYVPMPSTAAAVTKTKKKSSARLKAAKKEVDMDSEHSEPEDPFTGSDPLAQAIRNVMTTSTKYTDAGRIKYRWKLDIPTAVVRNHGSTNFRSESPEFEVEGSASSSNLNMTFSLVFYLNFNGSGKFEVKLKNLNDEMVDLCLTSMTLTHVDLNGREISKPFGGSQKVRSSSSFTMPIMDEVSVYSTPAASFPFLSKLFSYLQWTNLSEVSLLFELDLEIMKMIHV